MPSSPPEGRPFVKGQSGNPGGRPKTKALRKKLKALEPAAIAALREALLDGEWPDKLRAAGLVLAYRYGKPSESVELSGPNGENLVVEIVKLPPME